MEAVINQTSSDCFTNVKEGFNTLYQWTNDATKRDTVKNYFNITGGDLSNTKDRDNFMGIVFSAFQGIIQYTYDARRAANFDGLDIGHACDLMNDKKTTPDVVRRLANVYGLDAKYDMDGALTMNIDYKASLVPLQATKPDPVNKIDGDVLAGRGWLWLCCGNLGYMQTTDTGSTIWNGMLKLSFFTDMCADIFDKDADGLTVNGDYVAIKVSEAQQHFGRPWEYKASNVVLPNGDFDPWHSLGTNVSIPDKHQIAVHTAGAAHCSDMYPEAPNEPKALKRTREIVRGEVRYYLTGNEAATTQPPPSGTTKGAAGLTTASLLVVIALMATFVSAEH
ncbi:Protein C26B9.5 [Aphelenchoides avenae]|nr:Protein C26B9.5 [Aphelenchus avenae]